MQRSYEGKCLGVGICYTFPHRTSEQSTVTETDLSEDNATYMNLCVPVLPRTRSNCEDTGRVVNKSNINSLARVCIACNTSSNVIHISVTNYSVQRLCLLGIHGVPISQAEKLYPYQGCNHHIRPPMQYGKVPM